MFVRFFLLIVVFCVMSLPAWAGTVFFDSLPDVPVAAGLEILPEEGVRFDKPEGRIAEVVAVLAADGDHPGAAGIVQFYDQVLPSFGWVADGEQSYVRGPEGLKFWFEVVDGETYFHVLVEPIN